MRLTTFVATALTGFALAALVSASAAAETPIFSRTLRGELVVTGNTLGLDANTDLAPGTGGGIGTFVASPRTAATEQDGTYPIGTTSDWLKNGSEAVLDLPAGVKIEHAELIWACSSKVGGQPATALDAPRTVQLGLPRGAFQTITPSHEATNIGLLSTNYTYYQRRATVTDAIVAGGPGRYELSGVVGIQTPNASFVTACGWSLFVVYQDPDLPMRNINIWDVGEPVKFTGAGCPCETTIPVEGFCTPTTEGQALGEMTVTAFEGDARFTDDTLQIADPLFVGEFFALSGPNNAQRNFFASQINDGDGLLDKRGTFGRINHSVDPADGMAFTLVPGARQGWDITSIPLNDDLYNPFVLDNGQSQTTLLVTTAGDDFVVSAIGLELDFASPDLGGTHQVDKTLVAEGEEITFTVPLTNEGSGRADRVFFCYQASANTSFVAGSFKVDGTADAAVTSGALDPQKCSAATGGVALGSFEPAQTKVVTLRYRVNTIAATPATFREASGTPSWRLEWAPPCDGAPGETDQQTGETLYVPGWKLVTTLTANPTTPPALGTGDTVTYTLTVTNVGTGNSPAGVTARLPVPTGVSYVAGSTKLNGSAVADGPSQAPPFATARAVQSQGAPAGVIAGGASAVVTFQVLITATETTTITETGHADPDGPGPGAELDTDPVETLVVSKEPESDVDHDGIPDSQDNCVFVANTDQLDQYPRPNGNGIGDACDDVDKDGIKDLAEDQGPDGSKEATGDNTNPENPDTDGDGLCDGHVQVGPCVGVEDTDEDFDGGDRGTTETDPNNPDTDGDGLCDALPGPTPCAGGEKNLGTDPLDTDSDDDGLCDALSTAGGAWDQSGCKGGEVGIDGDYDFGTDTDPTNPDTDGDSLCDGFQNGATTCTGGENLDGDYDPRDFDEPADNETNPIDPDTDHGGVNDGVETHKGTNPRDPCVGDDQVCLPDPSLFIAEGGACGGGAAGGDPVWIFAALGALTAYVTRRRG